MAEIICHPEALKNYNHFIDPDPKIGEPLSFIKRQLLAKCITLLEEWPPSKWYDLRAQKSGLIFFQLEPDKFAEILGFYEDGVVKITHCDLKN